MERLIIEVNSSKNVEVLTELLKKFNFITTRRDYYETISIY